MRRFDVAWVVLWAALSSAWCLTAAQHLSAAFDEPNNLRWGITSWRTGSNYDFMRAGTMPLSSDVQYLPIHIWEWWRGEPFDTDRDFHTILPYARAMDLVFWWLLLGYGTAVARTFAGPWAGRFAVVLLATEPNFLGHATFALTDISVTAMILVFAYHYYHGRDAGRVRRWLVPGVIYGLAMAAKASALTFVPLIMVAFEVPRWRAAGAFSPPPGVSRVRHFWRASAAFRADFWKILAVGTVVIWTYCGCDWKPQPSFVKLADGMAEDSRWTPAVRWLAHNLKVFPNAGEAFAYQIKHNIRGHGSNLFGTGYVRGIWYYFPVALSIKLTLPVLLLLAGLLLRRPRSLFTPVGLAALLLLVFSLNCRVQIGVRLVFPLVAMLLLTAATGLARATAPWSDRARAAVLAVLTAACVYPAVQVWPDGLRYSNELWGGPENTYKYLGDSNYDWGQGLKDLDRWTAEHGLPESVVWYYGMDPVIRRENDRRLLALHNGKLYPIETPADTWKYVRGKVVAVGFTMLYGCPPITPTMPHAVEFFHGQQPIGRTRSFLVYDFRNVPDPP
jgi:hypothetical protein